MTRLRWTDAMDEYLRTNRGHLSAATIGRTLNVSRNAVLGRAHRLNLTRLGQNDPVVRSDGQIQPRPRGARLGDMPQKRKPPVLKFKVPEMADMKRLPLADLLADHCRWPAEGEGRHILFCGRTKLDGKPYCGGHCSIAYMKLGDGRRVPHQHFVFAIRRTRMSTQETLTALSGLDAA